LETTALRRILRYVGR